MAQNDGLSFDSSGDSESNPWANSANDSSFDADNPFASPAGADAPWDTQFDQTSMMAPVPGAPGAGGAVGSGGGNRGLTIAIAVLAVVLIALVGGVAWVLLGNKDDSSSMTFADDATGQGLNDESVVVTETSTARRAENFTPPGNWSSCYVEGKSGDYGNFDRCFKSGSTSSEFADNVYKAFREEYQKTQNTQPMLKEVLSPVTGKRYDMSCEDNGDYVTCSGGKYVNGDNAHVHIV